MSSNISITLDLNLINILIIILIAGFIISNTCISCIHKENMANIFFNVSKGVHNDKYEKVYEPGENFEKVSVPLPEGQLFYYGNNDFKPECCEHSTVSGTGGCACETSEQKQHLASRGGNKSDSKWDETF
jgi:hypothetical protein|tara:strand:- start:465 stop:854 length:390 start_codon:yes stop_codon:yes gene_type:complete